MEAVHVASGGVLMVFTAGQMYSGGTLNAMELDRLLHPAGTPHTLAARAVRRLASTCRLVVGEGGTLGQT